MKKRKKEKKKENRKSNKGKQKNKTGDSAVESNDGPEIPDEGSGRPQTFPAFLRGINRKITKQKQKNKELT